MLRLRISGAIPLFLFMVCTVTNVPSLGHEIVWRHLERRGTRWRNWLRHCATSRKVSGSIPDDVIGIFHWHNSLAFGVDSATNRNEYQRYLLEGKGGRCVGLQPYRIHVTIISKSASLNLLEPSGPAQACTGIAFPLLLSFTYLEDQHVRTCLFVCLNVI